MDKQNDLISRLQDEADLCRNDGVSDIAVMLDEATEALREAAAELDAAVARERGRCAELCDLAESAAWALWDTEADPADQGKATQAAALAAQIRGA